MLPVLFSTFLQVGDIFSDLDLILKVVGLLFIISFVRNHVQHALLSVALIVLLSGFLLFDGWKLFGTGLVLYLFVAFGAVGILVDLMFFGAFAKPPPGHEGGGGGGEHEGVTSKEVQERLHLQHRVMSNLFGKRGGHGGH